MDAENFFFNGKELRDFGYIICEFDGEENIVSVPPVSFTTIKPPGDDRKKFISASYDDTIVFEFSITKFDCYGEITDIDAFEDSAMRKWLCREDGFHPFMFYQDGFEEIYYNAQINLTPKFINGKIRGYRLIVTTDNAYGYSELLEKEFDLSPTLPYQFLSMSDRAGYIYPVWEFTAKQNGDLCIKVAEDTNQTNTIFHNMKSGDTIILDSDRCIIEGIDVNNFNWIMPRIVQGYEETQNTITSTIPCHVKIKYKLTRKAVG